MKKLLVGIMLIVGLMSVGCSKVDMSKGMSSDMSDKELLNVYVDNLNEQFKNSKEYNNYKAILDEETFGYNVVIMTGYKENDLTQEEADKWINGSKELSRMCYEILCKMDRKEELDSGDLYVTINVNTGDNYMFVTCNVNGVGTDEVKVDSYLNVRYPNGEVENQYGDEI